MRSNVKANMVLDAVAIAWKARDFFALGCGFRVLAHCVGDENNALRFEGNVTLMETAKSVARQGDDAAKNAANEFLSKF
jgi:hypothetical protein